MSHSSQDGGIFHFGGIPQKKSVPFKLGVVFHQKTTARFEENNGSFWKKQRIVLEKTTCRFGKNNVSFWKKQRIVLKKTTCRFEKNNVSFWKKQRVVLMTTTRCFLLDMRKGKELSEKVKLIT